MSISIIFPDEAGKRDLYSYCYVEKTLPDHRKLKKKVLIENLIPALRGNMESTFFTISWVCCLKIFWMQKLRRLNH